MRAQWSGWSGAFAGLLAVAVCFAVRSVPAQTAAAPLLPAGIAYDAAGNLYFADTRRQQVYEAPLAGGLIVVAGSGTQGFAGDGGPAISAALNAPQGVAVGADGTLYIADTGNQRIRSIVKGQIATFAGTGVAGFAGDEAIATRAAFDVPSALAVDASGALLVCDSANHRIRRISGGVVTTIAGNGVQGFAGDGAVATAAELDSPAGVAGGSDGRVFVADSHNNRIRVIAVNGTIQTIAGTGQRGFSGDGAVSTQARLALPRGIVLAANGAVLFADANNQRIRMIDAQGIISTVAGDGVQGNAVDGTVATSASLNTPRGVALSSLGAPAFTDAFNRAVKAVASNGNLYAVAGFAPARSSAVTVSVPANATYGQATANVSVSGSAGTPQGAVTAIDSGAAVVQATLAAGAATLSLAGLVAGPHTIEVAFAGDGLNPGATSAPANVVVAPASLTATANGAEIPYGAAIPALTGTLSGVLAQDSGNVSAVFASTAAGLAPVGIYPIGATLTGSAAANYFVTTGAGSGALQIVPAASVVVAQMPSQNSYMGLPLMLSATVASSTSGTPTGAVNFFEGNVVVATGTLAGGVASATYLAPAIGSHVLVASYGGDGNFKPGSSTAVTAVVNAMPDFAVASSGNSSQTVQAGSIATYTIAVSAAPGPFTGDVVLSASGLPAGATVSFSPAQVVPGATGANVTMSLQTAAKVALVRAADRDLLLLAFGVPLFFLSRRKRLTRAWWGTVCAGVLLSGLAGCGARTVSTTSSQSTSYAITVRGTSTNLAGAVVVRSTAVTLLVQ